VLEHGATSPPDLDWAAKGFQTLEEYKARNEQKALMCGVVRLR
jgi:hypothetical protein